MPIFFFIWNKWELLLSDVERAVRHDFEEPDEDPQLERGRHHQERAQALHRPG